ncbi:MAG: TonB-dependent receptor [bacterium]
MRGVLLLWAAALPFMLPGPVVGQEGGTVRGRVTSAGEGAPLPGAHIMVEGTVRGGIAGADGAYVIPDVEPGPRILVFSMMGYRALRRRIRVPEGGTVRADAALEAVSLVMPDVVVTAGRQQQRTEEASAAVTVLPGEGIRSRAVPRLDAVLPLVPGVTMVDNQVGIRGSTGYSRGAGSRALVLLDGIPLLGGDTGNVRWEMLPPQMVERVEVVRGASSSLYGSSAMGGVVNVLTRSPVDEPGTWVRLHGGWWEEPYYEEYRRDVPGGTTAGISFIRSLSSGRGGLLLSGGWEDTGGYRQNGWREQGHLLLKAEGPRDRRGTWGFLALASRSDAGHFLEWAGPDDPYRVSDEDAGDWLRFDEQAAAFTWEQIAGRGTWFRVTPHLQRVTWEHHFHDSDASSGTMRGGLEAQVVTAGPWGTVTAGLSGGITGVASGIYEVSRVREGALFLQNEADLGPRLRLSAGLRRDLHGTDATPWRSVWSPRAAVVWQAAESLTLRVNGGRGFRAPSVAELFASTSTGGFQVIPNPDLVPETAWTWEGGAAWRVPEVLHAEVSLFDSRYGEMIEPGLTEGGDIQFRNIRDAGIRGAELSLRGVLPLVGTGAGLSLLWLRARERGSGEPLAYRRPFQAALTLERDRGPLRAGLDVRWGRRMESVTVYPFERRNDLWRVDGRLSADAAGMRWTLQSRNLTRYVYTVIERNLSAPREWMLTVERTWDD